MNLTIPADFPVGLAIRAEIKHGETRHVLTESPQATVGQVTEPVAPCPLSAIGEAPTGRSDRVAHETRRCSREVGYCEECGKPCEAAVVDFGIGPYEYWGRKCHDTNKQIVSKCCEATIFEDEDMTIVYEPEA